MASGAAVTVTGTAAAGQRLNRAAINLRRQGERGLNIAARAGRKRIIDQTGQELNLPKNYIGSLFTVRTANAQQLEAAIVGRRRPVQLGRFAARQVTAPSKTSRRRKKAGISVQVKRSGGRQTIKTAFFAPLKAGTQTGGNGRGVFRRVGKNRYPIEVLYGPSPDQVFVRVKGQLSRELLRDLRADLTRRVQGIAAQANGSAP